MTTIEVIPLIDDISELVKEQHLLQAADKLNLLTEQCGAEETAKLEQIKTSYCYLLSYYANGSDDNARDNILSGLASAMLQLLDLCRVKLLSKSSDSLFFFRHAELSQVQLSTCLDSYFVATKKIEILTSVDDALQNHNVIDDTYLTIEKIETEIFNCVWAIWPSSDDEINLLKSTFANPKASTHLLCLITSALFLSCMSAFDEQKMLLLLELYKNARNLEIKTRALVGFVLAAYCHKLHVKYSRHIALVVSDLAESPTFTKDLFFVWKRLIMSRNSENIKERLNNDIIGTINKLMPESFKKNFNKDRVIDMSDIQANPEWQKAFEKSGLDKKIEEFNELQMSGSDVFLSTFSNLKSFPFFQTMSNWFLPFHKHHSAVREILKHGNSSFDRMITDAPLMCNSDKYSLVLSMKHIPQEIRGKMFAELETQNASLNESLKSELANVADDTAKDRLINSYIHDLYRFFKLFSRRREFFALFDSDFHLEEVPFIGQLLTSTKHLEFAADYYLDNLFYADAIWYYKLLLDGKQTISPVLYQKLGLAYQNTGRLSDALEQYLRYELADDANLWNIRHIAICYRGLSQTDKALAYYKKAERLAPNKLATYLNIGHCLLDLNQPKEALDYYFKAELADDKHTHKAWRPIAWTAFLCGQYEQSEKYHTRILEETEASSQDVMNYAHLLFVQGKVSEAIAHYVKALGMAESEQTFFSSFNADIAVLQAKCPPHADVALLHDAIKFKSQSI